MKYLGNQIGNSVLFSFSDFQLPPCGRCGYACFSDREACPYFTDMECRLLDAICQSETACFIVPNYCDFPCANFFIFNERSQCYFQGRPELLERYLNIPKKFVVVSNSKSDNFPAAFVQHCAGAPDILYIRPNKYQKSSILTDLIKFEEVRDELAAFLNICSLSIELVPMTQTLARRFFSEFENDPDVFEKLSCYHTYVYSDAAADAYWQKQQRLGRIHLAVMLGQNPVGEIILKDVDTANGSCTLSIHLQNDSVKNRGYGTQAEILALKYAFHELGLETVFADARKKNLRSRRVLDKVGFCEIRSDDEFVYYRCDKNTWKQIGQA